MRRRVRIVGAGRAGGAFALALARCGWRVLPTLRRGDPVAGAAAGVDLCLLAVPDGMLAAVAAAITPVPGTVMAHCSGAADLDVLAPHPRRASLHPLVSLPTAEVGAGRLLDDCPFAVDGDPLAAEAVADLGGRAFTVAPGRRALYHAAAAIAANHVVAVLGQAERVAATAGVPFAVYAPLVRGAVERALAEGPASSLTGPVARGDWDTVQRHTAAIAADCPEELDGYLAGVGLAARLAAHLSASPPGAPGEQGTAVHPVPADPPEASP